MLVAVSGGADSVALIRGLAAMKQGGAGRLVVGHFNHRWRGTQSDGDEAFVRELAAKMGLTAEVGRAESPPLAASGGEGIESAARRARYDFLLAAAGRVGARYIATAHTADDQAETILHRILRGTGIAGLAGIPRVRLLSSAVTLIRPLLEVSRQDVLDYLREIEQDFREDASNADVRFTRNRLRHELLPLLARDYNPQVQESLLRLGSLAAEAQVAVDQQVETLLQHVERQDACRVALRCSALTATSDFLLRELLTRIWREQNWPLQAMSHGKWCELAASARGADDIVRDFPGPVRAEKQGEWLVLTRPE